MEGTMPSRKNMPCHPDGTSNQVLSCPRNFVPLSGEGRPILPPPVQHDFVPLQSSYAKSVPSLKLAYAIELSRLIDTLNQVPFNPQDVSCRAAYNGNGSNYCPPVVSMPHPKQIRPRKNYTRPSQRVKNAARTTIRKRAARSRISKNANSVDVHHRQLSPSSGKNGQEKLEPIFPVDFNRLLKSQSSDMSAITPAVSISDSNRKISSSLDLDLISFTFDPNISQLVRSRFLRQVAISGVFQAST
ncbi:unnamed protein product [Rodentolepis nana]|uniref:Uncharacterized protein n=1 Tax=Rodentolepis nana TaxID=102285 RepID=A0A0R3U0E8_RODNA|nr:unnamed protein product [Rodentolepis nana]